MSVSSVRPIWNPETGITDLDAGPAYPGASGIPDVRAAWTALWQQFDGTAELSDFTERLSREWAIETGTVEDLYEIEPEVARTLIERGFRADWLTNSSTDRPRDYVMQLLRDQRDVLDGIFGFVRSKRSLSTSYIKELHAALLRSQEPPDGVRSPGPRVESPLVGGDWKTESNPLVREGAMRACCPPERVAGEMDRLVSWHANHVAQAVPAEVQAAWLHHRFTQIRPFQSGNGRVARALATLVLVRDGLFPLVVTRDDKQEYFDALAAADDGDLTLLIDLIARLQAELLGKASAMSEKSRPLATGNDVQAALDDLRKAADKAIADKAAANQQDSLRRVFALADGLEGDLEKRLKAIMPELTAALEKVADNLWPRVSRSTTQSSHYFQRQTAENAKLHLGYVPETEIYKSWVKIAVDWPQRTELVFTIHGIEKPFNGNLVCAPFLEVEHVDKEGRYQTTLVPVAQEAFMFSYNEDQGRLLARFEPWRESVLQMTVRELMWKVQQHA